MTQYTLTIHAEYVILERGIKEEWVKGVLEKPAKIELDKMDPKLRHALGPIPEYGGRVLRVVYNSETAPWKVITAYFDRSMKGKL